MAALQLDVGGSSTQAVNQSAGGNAGITFAPKGSSKESVALYIAAAAVVVWLFLRKK